MKITSAIFVKGVVGEDEILTDGIPQVAFIGRSNVGKSSVINTLIQRRELARSSPTPGLTKMLNVYLVNKKFYLVDLPGYGFAQGSRQDRNALRRLIDWYLLDSGVVQKVVVLIIDAKIGLTDSDAQMLAGLAQTGKNIVILANKIDKLKKQELAKQLQAIRQSVSPYRIIPYSAKDKIGVGELVQEITRQ
jgi:GTP-binding protein